MRRKFAILLSMFLMLSAAPARAQKTEQLHIYFVDVEWRTIHPLRVALRGVRPR